MRPSLFVGQARMVVRVLTPEQETTIRDAVVAGAKPKALANAYGVTVRTIYRTLARKRREAVDVVVGDYRATFELRDDGPPIQATEWRAA